jgi:hypothetical protein
MPQLKIAREFSRTPGPRYEHEGPHSGELFRRTILCPRLLEAQKQGASLQIDLDGTAGYGTSFLEEVFGGLIREDGLSLAGLKTVLRFVSREEPYLIGDIEQYMRDASERGGATR